MLRVFFILLSVSHACLPLWRADSISTWVQDSQFYIVSEGMDNVEMESLYLSDSSLTGVENIQREDSIFTHTLDSLAILKIDISNRFKLPPLEDIQIEARSHKKDHIYAILKLLHRSQPNSNGKGMCASGDEEYLLWLKFDREFKLVQSQLELVQSCFQFEKVDSRKVFFDPKSFYRGLLFKSN